MKKKHKEAKIYLDKIVKSNFYKKHMSNDFQFFFIFLQQRNDDQLLIENKLIEINQSSKKEINALFENSKIKTIEILGFFTAIIAFIFGTITIVAKYDLFETLILLASFALIMIVFLLVSSIVFINKEIRFYEDNRFWALAIIIILNSILIYFSPTIKEFLFTL